MSERRRVLPSWMATKKKENKMSDNESLRSRRKQKTARAVFYCMNEKELVEAAVSYLTKGSCENEALLTDQQVEDKATDTTVKVRDNPSRTNAKPTTEAAEEECSDCSDAQETTCVSEKDLDITVPYTKSPQHRGPEGQRSGPVQDHGSLMNVGLEAEKKEEHSQMPADSAEEEDALRLVREIFFT